MDITRGATTPRRWAQWLTLREAELVLLPGEARTIDLGGFGVTVLADEDTTDSAFSIIETAETAPGLGPPLHIHRDCAESFYVISGSYRMHLDGQDFDCPAGSFVHVPLGMRHTFQSVEPGSRKLNLYTPAGHGWLFRRARGGNSGRS